MEQPDATGEEILKGLCDPGLQIVFIDESGTQGKPLPGLAADYVVMCGVSMASENYQRVKEKLQNILADLRVDEFHATEIFNPRSISRWRRIRPRKRKKVLAVLAGVIAEYGDSVFYCYVSGEQYYEFLQPKMHANGGPDLDHKEALFKVFFNSLIPRLQQIYQRSAIVIDSVLPVGYEAIGLQTIRDPRGFYKGKLIHADSRVEVGIQLADFVAYTLNRIHHINQRRQDGKSTDFDEFVMELAKLMESKLVHLLGS